MAIFLHGASFRFTEKAFILALLSMAIIQVWFSVIGMNDVWTWSQSTRDLLAGVLCLFIAEVVSGRLLTHRAWRPGLLLFYFCLFSISYITVSVRAEYGIRAERMNYELLTFMPAILFLFLTEFCASRLPRLRAFLSTVNILFIAFFTLSAFIYIGYWFIFDAAFTEGDMVSVLLTHRKEVLGFISSHMGYGSFAAAIAAFLLFLLGVGFFVLRGNRPETDTPLSHSRITILVLLFLASAISIHHYAWELFPLSQYTGAQKYLAESEAARRFHEQNIGKLRFASDSPPRLSGTVLLVIGETANRTHMKAFQPDYPIETTPWLSEKAADPGFFLFPQSYSNYPITIKAHSMYLTNLNQYNKRKQTDMITIADVAQKAGYDTYFISNPNPSRGNVALSLIADNAKERHFTKYGAGDDAQVMEYLEQIPKSGSHFIVLRIEGSHDTYRDRLPKDYVGIQYPGHPQNINDYDSTLLYTDEILQRIFEYARDHLHLQILLYASDHGEDFKLFHGDGAFTWDMVRIPFFIYLSPEYRERYPETVAALTANKNKVFTNDLVFDALCGLMRLPNNGYEEIYDISSPAYSLTKEKALVKHGMYRVADEGK